MSVLVWASARGSATLQAPDTSQQAGSPPKQQRQQRFGVGVGARLANQGRLKTGQQQKVQQQRTSPDAIQPAALAPTQLPQQQRLGGGVGARLTNWGRAQPGQQQEVS